MTFASTAFSAQMIDPELYPFLRKNGAYSVGVGVSPSKDISTRHKLDSLCGPGRFVGGGFSHSEMVVYVQTYYMPSSGMKLFVKDRNGVFYDTGYLDWSLENNGVGGKNAYADSLDLMTALSLDGVTLFYNVDKEFERGDESFCMDMPESIESALAKVKKEVKNDLQNQTVTNDYRGGSYVEVEGGQAKSECNVNQNIYADGHIYLKEYEYNNWRTSQYTKLYTSPSFPGTTKVYRFGESGPLTYPGDFYDNNHSNKFNSLSDISLFKSNDGSGNTLIFDAVPVCVTDNFREVELKCDSGYSTSGLNDGSNVYLKGELPYYRTNDGQNYVRNQADGSAKGLSPTGFDLLNSADKEITLKQFGQNLSTQQACKMIETPVVPEPEPEPEVPTGPVYNPNEEVALEVFCPSGYTTDGKNSGNTKIGLGIVQFYNNKDGLSYVKDNANDEFIRYSQNDLFSSTSRQADVEKYGRWQSEPKICLPIESEPVIPVEPVEPVDPEIPPVETNDPVFSFTNSSYLNCTFGETVGGVVDGKTYRMASIDYYAKTTDGVFGYWVKDKAGVFSKVEMVVDPTNGDSFFPTFNQSQIEKYGVWQSGSEESCATPNVEPPIEPEQPPQIPAYMFDLQFYQYCAFNETVGGVVGGSNSRNGKVPVYFLFDNKTFESNYYFFDGSNYTKVEMIDNNGVSSFPTLTEEMVKKYGAMDTNSIESCKALPEPEPKDPEYSFDLGYYEYCAPTQTVGGVVGGSNVRTGKVPVFNRYDSKLGKSQNYFFDGKEYSEIEMVKGAEYDSFPQITKDMVSKYGSMNADSIEECKDLPPQEPTLPSEPIEGWNETGVEQCAVGSTVGGVEGGSTIRKGTLTVWYSWFINAEQNYTEKYFFKTPAGTLNEFNYDDYAEYKSPDWTFGKDVVDKNGVWNEGSIEACMPVKSFTTETEVRTVNCVSPLTGTLTEQRTYNLWSNGDKDTFSEWSTTANNCVASVEPPVVIPPVIVEPEEPEVPVDPVDPVEPVEPELPDDRFTTISDFQTSTELCLEGQTGSIKYNEYRTYDYYVEPAPIGTIKNDTGWVKKIVSNTCKELTDDVIEITDGEREDSCPAGSIGKITIKGQWITKGISGKTFVETSRVDSCIADVVDYESEFETEVCAAGETGLITKIRFKAIKSDGSTAYPYGQEFKVYKNTCSGIDTPSYSGDNSEFKTEGLLRNQSVQADNSAVIRTLTEYVNNVDIVSDGDYKLNIVANNISAINSDEIGSLLNAWITKTKGKVNIAGVPRSGIAYIGKGKITAENARNIIINSTILDLKSGNIVVSYKEATKGLAKVELDTFDIPLINVAKAGKRLSYVEFGGGTK
ncbi:hypothetical protein [Pseudomonas sp. ML2-2023-6]|uniref:hypothetical protein n=1 Tax=Pseudomonas sp. ML2-2023-6 TaxID=3122376 RepID=UPI0030D519F0